VAVLPSAAPAPTAAETAAFERPDDVPVCTFYISGSGCSSGSRCRFRHPQDAHRLRDVIVADPSAPAASDPSLPDEALADVDAARALAAARSFLRPGGGLDALLPYVAATEEGEAQVYEWLSRAGLKPAERAAAGAAAVVPSACSEGGDLVASAAGSAAGGEEAAAAGDGVRDIGDAAPPDAGLGSDADGREGLASEREAGGFEGEGEEEEEFVPITDRVRSLADAHGLWPSALETAESLDSEAVECGICMERPAVRKRQQAQGAGSGWGGLSSGSEAAMFGLLSGCAHAFCLGCIRRWRAQADVPKETARACPVCRAHAHLIVPCDRVVRHPVRRAQVLEAYTRRLRSIPCRMFDRGRGECAFGSSCFYEHRLRDGTLAPMDPPRLYYDGEGNVAGRRGMSLADFL